MYFHAATDWDRVMLLGNSFRKCSISGRLFLSRNPSSVSRTCIWSLGSYCWAKKWHSPRSCQSQISAESQQLSSSSGRVSRLTICWTYLHCIKLYSVLKQQIWDHHPYSWNAWSILCVRQPLQYTPILVEWSPVYYSWFAAMSVGLQVHQQHVQMFINTAKA